MRGPTSAREHDAAAVGGMPGTYVCHEMSAQVRDLFRISKPVNKFLIEIRYDGVRG